MSRVHKKPVTPEQLEAWIVYSLRGLAMAKHLCEKKGLDYNEMFERASLIIIEEKKDGYTSSI